MCTLYRLLIYSFPNGNEESICDIGLFASRQDAEAVRDDYFANVPGFRDYYCESEILEVPVIGASELPGEVWTYCGWNWDDDHEETELVDSVCYLTEADCRMAVINAGSETPREEWRCSKETVGYAWWSEGFTREYPDGGQAQTLRQIRDTLSACAERRSICAVEFEYEDNRHYYFPVAVNDQLFLGAEEDDFILDGFCVRRLRDVFEVSDRAGIYQKIFETEGLNRFDAPAVDISGWHSVFISLQKLGKNIIVENEYEDGFFRIGRIEAVGGDHVLLRHFDADGVWQDEPQRIEFREITSVTFGSRYIDVFSKYV